MRTRKDWFPNDKATHEWLDSMKTSTRNTYQSYWKYFLEFTGEGMTGFTTGDQILENRKTDKEYAWEKRVLNFKRWMVDVKKQGEKTATTATATARSFFTYHRVGLEFRPTEKRRLKEAKAKYEDYRFNNKDLAKMASIANLTEQYVLVAGKSFGLRAGDFLRLRRGDLEAYIDREPPISIGELATEKESVKAYPFIDSDAKPVIKLMLEKMNREGRINPTEQILTYTDTIQLSRIVRRLTGQAGINIGSKRVRFHCLRKFLCDRLSDVTSSEKWKQIVGKAINEKAYVSPDLLREAYKRAMDETCFTKTVSEQDMELYAKKQAAIMLLKLQGTTEEEIKKIFRSRKVSILPEEVKVLEELIDNQSNQRRKQNRKQERLDEEEIELRVAKRLLEGQAKAMGLNPKKILREKAMEKGELLTTAEEVIALQEMLSKRGQPRGGGLSFERQARKVLADIVVGALEDVKKRLTNDTA